MPSLRHLVIAAICAQYGLAGPVRKYLNSTSSSIVPAEHSPVDTTFPRPFSFPAPSTTQTEMRKAGKTTSADADGCESMTASSSADISQLPVITTVKGSLGGSTPTKDAVHTVQPTHTGRHSNSTHSGNSGAFGGHQNGGKESISSTTTLTIYTTLQPHADASSSHAPAGSSGPASSYAASSAAGQSSSAAAGGSNSAAAGSSSAAPSSSNHLDTSTKTRHARPTSKVATWGTLTVHYTPSSQAASGVAPTGKTATRKTKHRHPAKTATTSSSMFYPYPIASGSSSSSAATADPIQTTASLTVTFSFNPTSATTSTSAPPVGTTLSPLPPPVPTTTTMLTPSSVAGITIVPINTDATTIYVTVTTTDAGVTTTLAAETVTAYQTGWAHGPP